MKYFLLLSAGLMLSAGAMAAGDSLAVKAYTMGGGNRESGYFAMRLDNGQSALFNITSNCNTAQCQHGMAGIRIDANGNMIFAKKIGSATIDVDPNRAIYTNDKHILMVGSYTDRDRLLIKMDTNFTVVWTREIKLSPSYDPYQLTGDDITELNGNYYLVFGNQFAKISQSGHVLLSKHYGALPNNTDPDNYLDMRSITQIGADRFFVAGALMDDAHTSNFSNYGFVSIIDTNGNILKQKKLNAGSPFDDEITHAFKESADKMKVFGRFDNAMYMADVDTNLAVTNAKKFTGGLLFGHSVCYNGSDRYFISAYAYNSAKIATFAIDKTGAIQWSKYIVNGSGFFRSINYMLSDCAFAIYSSTTVNTQIANKGFWAKLNENGQTASTMIEMPYTVTASTIAATVSAANAVDSGQWQTNFLSPTFIFDSTPITDSLWQKVTNTVTCPEPTAVAEVAADMPKDLCAPNPFYCSMEIGRDWELSKIGRLRVYDITGRTIVNEHRPLSRKIDVGDVRGVVFVQWEYEGKVYVQRMVGL